MGIGQNVRDRRLSKRLTQEELAKRVEVSRVMIAQIERGYRLPSLPLTMELARTLDCTMEDLLQDEGRQTK